METALPFGIRDIKLTPYTDAAATTLATTSVDLPYARTLSWTETEDFETLRGDDRDVAAHGKGASLSFEFESGGLPYAAFKVMAGGTITESGSGNTSKSVYAKKVTDQRPYFRIEGQSISDSGGDVHTIIHKAKCTGDLSGSFADGAFTLLAASGIGIAPASGAHADVLYEFVNNASVTAFVEPGVVV